MNTIEVLVKGNNTIGECPIYDADNKTIYWVDIINKKFFKYELESEKLSTFAAGKYDSYIIAAKNGDILLGMQDGLYRYNFDANKPELLGAPKPYNIYSHRFNDGKCDVTGRLWAGSTTFYEESEDCVLYRIENDYKFDPVVSDVHVSNGMGWSPDNSIMYYIDSWKKLIYRYEFDPVKGIVSNPKILIDFNKSEVGNPDGMTVDENGNLWIAHWGGSRVSCWSPKGKKVDQIMFPNRIPTCPLFVNDDLIVSTATLNYTKEQLAMEQPYAGSLLKIHVGIKGAPSYKFG